VEVTVDDSDFVSHCSRGAPAERSCGVQHGFGDKSPHERPTSVPRGMSDT
jgi:hypothetical protein